MQSTFIQGKPFMYGRPQISLHEELYDLTHTHQQFWNRFPVTIPFVKTKCNTWQQARAKRAKHLGPIRLLCLTSSSFLINSTVHQAAHKCDKLGFEKSSPGGPHGTGLKGPSNSMHCLSNTGNFYLNSRAFIDRMADDDSTAII
jgi:hypothetical protein